MGLEQLIDHYAGGGRHCFLTEEAQRDLGVSRLAVRKSAQHLIKRHKIVSPRQGFYVIVPPAYRKAGAPPALWYIDSLMRFLEQPYYVGLLSAAALHGSAHHPPHRLQVLTPRQVTGIEVGGEKIDFIVKKETLDSAVERKKTPAGNVAISIPEVTVYDLVRYYRHAGYFSHISTVFAELGEVLDAKRLAAHAADVTTAHQQRVGYLLDIAGHESLTVDLHASVVARSPYWIPLRPDAPRAPASKNEKWHVLVNDEVDPDL